MEPGGAGSLRQPADSSQPHVVQKAGGSAEAQLAQQPLQVRRSDYLSKDKQTHPYSRPGFFFPLLSSSHLGSPPLFQGLIRLKRLMFGGWALKELRRGDLCGVTELEELTVHANNLQRFYHVLLQWSTDINNKTQTLNALLNSHLCLFFADMILVRWGIFGHWVV